MDIASSAISPNHQWLISTEAETWLQRVAIETSGKAILPAYVKSLRRHLGPTRASLVLEQTQLRSRAREKFSQAEQLFFTPKGYEQATDELISTYKAQRFPTGETRYDFCCGIGGDAFGSTLRGPIHLVDRDPLALFYALENVRRLGGTASGEAVDVAEVLMPPHAAWHIDPDRRVSGQRTTQIDLGEPGLETLNRLRGKYPNGAIKLAPATVLPEDWRSECQAEWIESRGECRQLVAWFAELAVTVGEHTATTLRREGAATSFTGTPDMPVPETTTLGTYIYDPSPALLAAHLLGAWCNEHALQTLSARSLYLTGESLVASQLQQAFRLIATLPLDVTQLRAYFREHGIGRLEIKQRGVGITPEALRPQLHLAGEHEAVLILAELGSHKRALVCERVI